MDPEPQDKDLATFEQMSLIFMFRIFNPETLVTPLFLTSVNSITILSFSSLTG
jgi:hypothetical protein